MDIDIIGGYNSEIEVVGGGIGIQNPIPKRQTLQNFKSSFTSDPAKASNFDVLLFVPSLFFSDTTFSPGLPDIQKLALRCDSASFPGRSLQTQDLKIYGPIEKLPYSSTYEDITLSFICSSSMMEKNLFDLWLEYINPSDSWDFKFRNNYCTRIIVNQYDNTKSKVEHQIELIDAFPISVSPLQLNWADEGIHRLDVTFAYTYWTHISEYSPEYVPTINVKSKSYTDNLAKIISALAIARDISKNMGKDNPYGILSGIGTISSLFKIGNSDTYNDTYNTKPIAARGSYISDVDKIQQY